jgi:hypothetical protein
VTIDANATGEEEEDHLEDFEEKVQGHFAICIMFSVF